MEELERKRLHWQKVTAVVCILLLIVVTASSALAFVGVRRYAPRIEHIVSRLDSVTAELLDSGLCRYGRDYDLGDVVTVVADDRQRNARLTAVEETYEDGKRTLKATFGEGPVTLTGLIREKLRGSIA